MSINSVITGSGHYIPENIVKNDSFINSTFFGEDKRPFPNSNENIISKFEQITEIRERRYLEKEMINSDMATIAAHRAIKNANIDKEQIDYIIVAHNFGDISADKKFVKMMPSISSKVKHKLGIKNVKCIPYDMIFGCPGWVEALIMGHQYIQAGLAKQVLVVGSDTLSRGTDPHDRNCMIFSDGAGAVVLSAVKSEKTIGILGHSTVSHTGEEVDYLTTDTSLNPEETDNDAYLRMAGRKIYEYALKNVAQVIYDTLIDANLTVQDIDKVLMHQANAKMDHAILIRLMKLFNLKEVDDDFMPMTIQTLGNSSVATVPTLYSLIDHEELGTHKFTKGTNIVMCSVGAGMNINSVIYQFPN